MHVHLSTSHSGDVFSAQWTSGWRKDQDEGLPSFVWENITYGDWNDARIIDLDVKLPEVSRFAKACGVIGLELSIRKYVMRNGSLWADVFVVKDGASPNPSNPSFDPHSVHHSRKCRPSHWFIAILFVLKYGR
jgi:hypothetical protein